MFLLLNMPQFYTYGAVGKLRDPSSSCLWREGRLGKSEGVPQIIFAQVREDAAIELEILRRRPAGETVFCIGSGGCTAFSLLLAEPAEVQIVDINPAQIHLIEVKRAALLHLSYSQMMQAILQNAVPFYEVLRGHLSPETQAFWDANPQLLSLGLQHCGVIEQRLKQVMRFLPLVQNRRKIRRLFTARTLESQREIYRTLWDHKCWALAFEMVLNKPVLSLVYGREFVRAGPPRFAADVRRSVDDAFLRFPLQENGYLWQTFLGAYPKGEKGLPLYLQREHHGAVTNELPKARIACQGAALRLEEQEANSIGFFALSNILEVTSPEYARRLLAAVGRAAKPEALICLRSIFPFDESMLETADSDGTWSLERMPEKGLEERDRSFFCKNLRVLRVCKN